MLSDLVPGDSRFKIAWWCGSGQVRNLYISVLFFSFAHGTCAQPEFQAETPQIPVINWCMTTSVSLEHTIFLTVRRWMEAEVQPEWGRVIHKGRKGKARYGVTLDYKNGDRLYINMLWPTRKGQGEWEVVIMAEWGRKDWLRLNFNQGVTWKGGFKVKCEDRKQLHHSEAVGVYCTYTGCESNQLPTNSNTALVTKTEQIWSWNHFLPTGSKSKIEPSVTWHRDYILLYVLAREKLPLTTVLLGPWLDETETSLWGLRRKALANRNCGKFLCR